jgi:hypothetical protein
MEKNMSNDLTTAERRRGYILLRDGHAVPLSGISPDELKVGAKHRVLHPEKDHLKHRQTLNAIVSCLGFHGDFGTFQSKGWLRRHGASFLGTVSIGRLGTKETASTFPLPLLPQLLVTQALHANVRMTYLPGDST